MGINLGPIKVLNDVNQKRNYVGTGINDAQRIMSFSSDNELLVSQSYFDMLTQISNQYSEDFEYAGIKSDKHGHEHSVYLLKSVNPCLQNIKGKSPHFDQAILDRILKDLCCYLPKDTSEEKMQQASLNTQSIKELCEQLISEIQSSDDQHDFKQFLKECGYIGY